MYLSNPKNGHQTCRTIQTHLAHLAQKQTTHQETKTKLSGTTPNRDKTIHCQRKHRKSIPPAMSQQNQHLTHAMLRKPATTTPKQFQKRLATCRRVETFNQELCSPESCYSVTLAKKVTAAISFSGPQTIGFLDSKKWSSPARSLRAPE